MTINKNKQTQAKAQRSHVGSIRKEHFSVSHSKCSKTRPEWEMLSWAVWAKWVETGYGGRLGAAVQRFGVKVNRVKSVVDVEKLHRGTL